MATQFQFHDDDFERNAAPTPFVAPPKLTLVHDADFYEEIERPAPGVASRGLHPAVLGALTGLYAAMLASFWAFFARDTEAAMVMTAITVLMIMYFGLVVGGILSADARAPGERQRTVAEFLRGPVDTLNDVVTGRQAVVQILFLPACMLVLATTIGLIARFG